MLKFEILLFFSTKFEFFLFVVLFLGHFCMYLVTDKDYFGMIANFDIMLCM